jgi:hypothetical protein
MLMPSLKNPVGVHVVAIALLGIAATSSARPPMLAMSAFLPLDAKMPSFRHNPTFDSCSSEVTYGSDSS